MKAGNAVQKVKGGKLVRVEATFDTHLSEVTITGDFFLYPEEALEEMPQKQRDVFVWQEKNWWHKSRK